MLHMTPESIEYLARLRGQLSWLQRCYPEKKELIALAESHLRAIDSLTIAADGKITYTKGEQSCDSPLYHV